MTISCKFSASTSVSLSLVHKIISWKSFRNVQCWIKKKERNLEAHQLYDCFVLMLQQQNERNHENAKLRIIQIRLPWVRLKQSFNYRGNIFVMLKMRGGEMRWMDDGLKNIQIIICVISMQPSPNKKVTLLPRDEIFIFYLFYFIFSYLQAQSCDCLS